MVRIGLLIPVWQRHELARIVLAHYAKLKVNGAEIVSVVVGSEGDASRALADEVGALYVEAPNEPLSDKHNAGVHAMKGLHVDCFVNCGSDDLINAAYFEAVSHLIAEDCDYLALRGLWYYDAATKRLVYQHRGFPGAGTMLSAHILGLVDWNPWPSGLDRYLDGGLINRCRQHSKVQAWVGDLRETDVRIVDVKTEVSMWDFDTITARAGVAVPEKAPAAWLKTHFPRSAASLTKLV
jgi:hypothetical protein